MAAQGLVAEPDAPVEQPRGFARLRNWGRNIHGAVENGLERRQNIVEAIGNLPRNVGERASRIGEELGSAAVKLVEEAQGKIPEGSPATTAGPPAHLRSLDEEAAPEMSVDAFLEAEKPQLAQRPHKPPDIRPGMWEECEQMQQRLNEEREMRRGRALALNVLDEALRGMRAELQEEKRLLAEAEDERLARCSKLDSIERMTEELQEEHDRLQNQKVATQSKLRRLGDDAAAKARAERQASREGAWARDGPEMEALKIAKMELAELWSAGDEAKLRAKKEQAELTRELAAARVENEELKRRKDQQQKPKGLRGALGRLMKVARGSEDPSAGGSVQAPVS